MVAADSPDLSGWKLLLSRAAILGMAGLDAAYMIQLVRVADWARLASPDAPFGWGGAVLFWATLVTTTLSIVLAVALALRGGRRRSSQALALAVAAATYGALSLVSVMVPWRDHPAGELLMDAWIPVPAILTIGVGAFIRFAVLFPRRLTAGELALFGRVEADDSLGRGARFFDRVVGQLFGPGTDPDPDSDADRERAHKDWLVDVLLRRLPPGFRRVAATPVIPEAGTLLANPRRLWTAIGALAVVPYGLWFVEARVLEWFGVDLAPDDPLAWALWTLVFVWFFVTLLGGPLLAVGVLRLGYGLGTPAERRRMRWIVESLNAAAWLLIAGGGVTAASLLGIDNPLIEHLDVLAFGIIPLVIVTGFAVAVFYDGALEPRLVVRKSTLYGLFGFGLAFLFAITEETVTNHMTAQLGLPDGTGTLVASGVIAVVFGVFHGRFNRKVQRWLEEDDER